MRGPEVRETEVQLLDPDGCHNRTVWVEWIQTGPLPGDFQINTIKDSNGDVVEDDLDQFDIEVIKEEIDGDMEHGC